MEIVSKLVILFIMGQYRAFFSKKGPKPFILGNSLVIFSQTEKRQTDFHDIGRIIFKHIVNFSIVFLEKFFHQIGKKDAFCNWKSPNIGLFHRRKKGPTILGASTFLVNNIFKLIWFSLQHLSTVFRFSFLCTFYCRWTVDRF